jgi:hypothetical protein
MDNHNQRPGGIPAVAPPLARTGRGRRLVTSAAAAIVLLGSGAAIGVALTGGAAASTGKPAASGHHPAAAAPVCRKLAVALLRSGHPAAARHIKALCASPLLRLVAGGAMYGQITLRAKDGGSRVVAFERGTVKSVAGSSVLVTAANGTSWTWDLMAGTVVRESGHQVAAGTLSAGDQVLVAGQVVAGTNDARLIRIRPAR